MATIRVEVVYARPEGADAVTVRLASDATVADALAASGILQRHPEALGSKVGIFGKLVAHDVRIADGDRVEVYRPLAIDPKEARRERAKQSKAARARRKRVR